MKYTEIKSIKGWEASKHNSWGAYCNPGDLVSEDVFEYFLNILPPKRLSAGYLQVGGAIGTALNKATGKLQDTYMTFICTLEKGIYQYCGNCFVGNIREN
nr:MAG TPA: hypothetical protein [Caudoviricetes sp.]